MPKVANNTYCERRDNGDLAFRLHSTDVVVQHLDGTCTLDSGGWRTVTTKERLNRYAPCRVYQKDYAWYVVARLPWVDGTRAIGWDWDNPVPFEDGMRVDANGRPV